MTDRTARGGGHDPIHRGEHLEALATSRRRALRLAAGALLEVDARLGTLRRGRGALDAPTAPTTDGVAPLVTPTVAASHRSASGAGAVRPARRPVASRAVAAETGRGARVTAVASVVPRSSRRPATKPRPLRATPAVPAPSQAEVPATAQEPVTSRPAARAKATAAVRPAVAKPRPAVRRATPAGSVSRHMADAPDETAGTGAPGRAKVRRPKGAPAATAHPFPEELERLAEQTGGVGEEAAWDAWLASDHGDRLAMLDADMEREPGTAVKVEDGLSRAAAKARRGSIRALGALSFGTLRAAREV